jgi:hypothetical protein
VIVGQGHQEESINNNNGLYRWLDSGNFYGALKTRAKVRSSGPFCWHFCWYRGAGVTTYFRYSERKN